MNNERESKTDKNKILVVFEWIYRTIILTFAFVAFSLLGLVIFGVGPALRAGQKIALSWINDEEYPFLKTYYKNFIENFWKNVFISWVFIFMISVPIINYSFFLKQVTDSFLFSSIIILGVLFIIVGVTGFSNVYYFINEFNTKHLKALKFSVTITFGKILGVLINLVIVGLLVLLVYLAPYIFGFFAPGIYMIVSTKISSIMFKNINAIYLN